MQFNCTHYYYYCKFYIVKEHSNPNAIFENVKGGKSVVANNTIEITVVNFSI